MSIDRASTLIRFLGHVEFPDDRRGCWRWVGNCPGGRHGHFAMGSDTVKAHRWIYEFVKGPIEPGQLIRHACDNPWCVNPTHLLQGTAKDNVADMHERGRNADRRGEKHPMRKLVASDIYQIRSLGQRGMTQKEIAADVGISRQQVGRILRGSSWGHI